MDVIKWRSKEGFAKAAEVRQRVDEFSGGRRSEA